MNGPFNTQREARAAVAHILDSPPGTWGDGNRRLLEDACRSAGLELGALDERIVTWLAGFEPWTVAVIAGLIARAHAGVTLTPEQHVTVLDALHDAKWSHVIIGCADCDAVELAGEGESVACERHKADE